MFNELQECVVCQGTVPRRDFVQYESESGVMVTLLLCDFCGWGNESHWSLGDNRVRIFTLDYRRRTEPKNFRRFANRLRELREAMKNYGTATVCTA